MSQLGDTEFGSVVSFRLRPEEARKLRELARADDRPVSVFMRRLTLRELRDACERRAVEA